MLEPVMDRVVASVEQWMRSAGHRLDRNPPAATVRQIAHAALADLPLAQRSSAAKKAVAATTESR